MQKDPQIYIDHILQSIDLIEKRINGVSREKFIQNVDLQDMVIRRLQIVGEAARRIPKEFRETHGNVGWQDPANMRSVLVHGYDEVDLNIVWTTINKNIPILKKQIEELSRTLQK